MLWIGPQLRLEPQKSLVESLIVSVVVSQSLYFHLNSYAIARHLVSSYFFDVASFQQHLNFFDFIAVVFSSAVCDSIQ